MEEANAGESWNKGKIIITVFLLVLLITGGYLLKTSVFGDNSSPVNQKSVKGTSVEEKAVEPTLEQNIQETIREKINNLKQEVLGLDVIEIASSSPQVQKILNDIKSLEQYPANQVKEICQEIYKKVCGL